MVLGFPLTPPSPPMGRGEGEGANVNLLNAFVLVSIPKAGALLDRNRSKSKPRTFIVESFARDLVFVIPAPYRGTG